MASAKQSSMLPTRKLSFGVPIASVLTVYAQPSVAELWPQVAPAIASGPAVTNLVSAAFGAVLGIAVAYWVPDAPNVPS